MQKWSLDLLGVSEFNSKLHKMYEIQEICLFKCNIISIAPTTTGTVMRANNRSV